MKNFEKMLVSLCVSLAYLMIATQPAYATVAGHVQFVIGNVQIANLAGQLHPAHKGDEVNEGDTLISASAASAQIRMMDGGLVAMRPDTKLKFDQFVFKGRQDGNEKSFFSLFKGGFRAITGLIGQLNKQNYRITTPAATIGIRGTDHETVLVAADSPLAQVVPAGAYSKVNVGETSLTTHKGTINVMPNQMGFAGGLDQIPKLQPLNTNIFTVAPAPTQSTKVDKNGGKNSGSNQGSSNIKESTSTSSGQGSGTAASSDAGSGEAGVAVRPTAVVDAVAPSASLIQTPVALAPIPVAPVVTPPAAPTTFLNTSIVAGGATVNITNGTVTATTGAVLPVTSSIYSGQAQAAAAAAQAAAAAARAAANLAVTNNYLLTAIAPVSTAPATSAITAATGSLSTATPAVSTATALSLATPLATATGNATTAQTTAATAQATAVAAAAALAAHGTFADTTASPANTTTQSANTSLQTANTAVQSAATTVTAQNTALTAAQGAASTDLSAANASLTTANTNLNTAKAQNTAIGTAQSSTATLLSTASTAAAGAQTAATAAQAATKLAASYQAAGDLVNAQAQMVIAQSQLTIAQNQQAAAQTAQTAVATQLANAQAAQTAATAAVNSATTAATNATTNATTAGTQAAAAQTASTTANTAVSTSNSNLATVNTDAPIVAANGPIAAYNNPAYAGNFIGHTMMSVATTGGFNFGESTNQSPVANTTFVLDGSGNLVEARSMSYQTSDLQSQTGLGAPVAGADIKWSGGTAADTFKLPDNSIYGGRWVNPTVSVNGVTVATPADSLWAVLTAPTVSIPSLVGTVNYTKAGNTTPFDSTGILGTLNSATLSADFTAQVVNAAINLTMGSGKMAGTFAVTGTNMPIQTASVNPGAFSSNVLPVSCSGTGCAAGTATGYSANLGGSFAGLGVASAGLAYNIWPTTTTLTPVSDLVQGLVAFTTSTTPTVLTGGPFAAYAANNVEVEIASTTFINGWGSFLVPPANLIYAGSGLSSFTDPNLGGGGGSQTVFVVGGITPVTASATSFATTGIQFGRWTSATTVGITDTLPLRSNSGVPTAWIYGPQGYLDTGIASPTTGQMYNKTFTYNLDGSTPVYDRQSGQTGTLTSASISANFTTNLVSANVAMLVGGQAWTASATNVGFGGNQFFANSSPTGTANNLTISTGAGTPTVCTTCYGSLAGAFTGQNYAGAMLSYSLYDNANTGGDVSGHAALVRTGAAITNGTPVIPTGYFVADYGGNIQTADTLNNPAGSFILTPGSVLTAYSQGNPTSTGYYSVTTVTCTACTSAAATSAATTGIYLGTWDAGSISSTYATPSMGSQQWITGPEAGPLFLPNALLGTKTYSFDGGMVTNGNGVAGTVSSSTALTVNFTKQVVGINLALAVNDTLGATHNWLAATTPGNEAVLNSNKGIGGAVFQASSYNGSGPGTLTVTVDGTTPGSGNVSGQLTGTGLNGAIMSYNLNATLGGTTTTPLFEQVNGVAALTTALDSTTTLSSITTPHQAVLVSLTDPQSTLKAPALGFYANATADVLVNTAGNATQFDMQFINNGGNNSSSKTLTSGISTLSNAGTDPTTGIRWGRWDGGSINVTNRATAVLKTVPLAGSLHWIAGPVETAAVTLPTTGTYTYISAGGTPPTDNLGNQGTATTTLSANFTNQTVAIGVNATVNGTTLVASAPAAPIIQSTGFYADSQMAAASPQHLAVTCTAGCGTSAVQGGMVVGSFVKAGALGAMMSYGLKNISPTNSQIISGVAAFHR